MIQKKVKFKISRLGSRAVKAGRGTGPEFQDRTNQNTVKNETKQQEKTRTGPKQETLYESLILAQDERWRRA